MTNRLLLDIDPSSFALTVVLGMGATGFALGLMWERVSALLRAVRGWKGGR